MLQNTNEKTSQRKGPRFHVEIITSMPYIPPLPVWIRQVLIIIWLAASFGHKIILAVRNQQLSNGSSPIHSGPDSIHSSQGPPKTLFKMQIRSSHPACSLFLKLQPLLVALRIIAWGPQHCLQSLQTSVGLQPHLPSPPTPSILQL